MLPTDELKRARADVQITLPDVCSVLTASRTPDGAGGAIVTWTTTRMRVKCRLDAKSGSNPLQAAAVQQMNQYVLTLPADVTLTFGQRVLIGSHLYNVVNEQEGSLGVVARYTVEEL